MLKPAVSGSASNGPANGFLGLNQCNQQLRTTVGDLGNIVFESLILGSMVVAQDHVASIVNALTRLLTDDVLWSEMSEHARSNARRFHWHDCSAPLVATVDDIALEIAVT